jgi:hypothetical protein
MIFDFCSLFTLTSNNNRLICRLVDAKFDHYPYLIGLSSGDQALTSLQSMPLSFRLDRNFLPPAGFLALPREDRFKRGQSLKAMVKHFA